MNYDVVMTCGTQFPCLHYLGVSLLHLIDIHPALLWLIVNWLAGNQKWRQSFFLCS